MKSQYIKQKPILEASGEAEENGGDEEALGDMTTLYKYLTDLTKEICELKVEMKNVMSLHTSFKQEFTNFAEEVNIKLKSNSDKLQDKRKSLTKAKVHIEELETFNMEAKEAPMTTLREQRKLQEKLTDLEGRSRRNNVWIFGVPEGSEVDLAPHFVEELLQRVLALPVGTNLPIQHRSQ